jgi:predicted PurR-regulated permease PerM
MSKLKNGMIPTSRAASWFAIDLPKRGMSMDGSTALNIGAMIISPAVLIPVIIFMINTVNKRIDKLDTSINKRIDDLRSKMDSDHANLAKMVESVDKRLENLNQNFVNHLEFHATQTKQETD